MQFATIANPARPGLRKRPPTGIQSLDLRAPLSDLPPQGPEQIFEAACEDIREACVTRRFTDAADAARKAMPTRDRGTNDLSVLRVLAEALPAPLEAPGEDRLWVLQRMDGTMIALVRLCDNGMVSNATHPNESHWTMRDGCLLLCTPDGKPTTVFSLSGLWKGQRVMAGLFMDSVQVHVLTEVDCAYSRLRTLDPELTGSCGLLIDPAKMTRVELPPVPAVILAAQRTGSHLLINLLNSTSRVFFDSELLDEKQVCLFGDALKQDDAGLLYSLRMNDPVQFCKVMMARSHHTDGRMLDDVPVRGFKLFAKHSLTAWNWVMDEPSMRIVHLHRANLLAEFSSLLVAYAEGHWVGGPQALRSHRIRFEPARFARFVDMKRRYLDKVREQLAARAGPSIEIEYSAFSRQSINGVMSFLLGEPHDAQKLDALGLRRQLNEGVLKRFDNPQEVLACLRAMGHEEWAESETPEVAKL